MPGIDGGLCPVGEVQLAQDVADVPLDGILANDQLPGNCAVVQPTGDQSEDLDLAVGQINERVQLVFSDVLLLVQLLPLSLNCENPKN